MNQKFNQGEIRALLKDKSLTSKKKVQPKEDKSLAQNKYMFCQKIKCT